MTPVSVRLVDDPHEVVRVAGDWLAEHRIEANVAATILAAELATERGGARRNWSWALAVDGSERVAGVGVHTPPHYARLVTPDADLAALIADAWHDAGRALPGLSGPPAPAEVFVRRWASLTGRTARLVLREGLHVLERFAPAVGVPGGSRIAGPHDLDLVERWSVEFQAEALPHLASRVDVEILRRGLAEGRYVLWEDEGVPVSLAVWRTAGGVGRIGPVYTPPDRRRHGYAAAVTSAATQAILDRGADAMLYTDAANPTSNGVYARLGYRLVGEAVEWAFETPDA